MNLGKIVEITIAKPTITTQTIEETGRGRRLCYDTFLGRAFRDDPDCLRDICEKYREMYLAACEKLDEEPTVTNYEVTNWNELYTMIGIALSIVGDNWGLTNDPDWRVPLEFEYETVTYGPIYEMFGEPVFCFGPKEYCQPMECYREV